MTSITKSILFAILALYTWLPVLGQQRDSSNSLTVAGLIIPRDNDGMYVRTADGQLEIQWTEKTEVALEINTRLLKGLKEDLLRYHVQASTEVIDFPLPRGPITGIITLRGSNRVDNALKVAREENWIPESGLILRFSEKPVEQLPTHDDPRFVGLWDPTTRPRTLSIKGTRYEVSLKKGGQTNALLFNMLSVKDCKPFVNRARVIGRQQGDTIIADEIHLLPIGDQAASDDPQLPRYLFIGDSISGNYTKGLRAALKDEFNIHHPPTNCGPSGKGKNSIVEWLGAHEQEGRGWDVISFNFGHWDAGNDKVSYQANLESVIKELKKTGASLIWVTTCPVPRGFPASGGLTSDGKAPRRTSGVMQKFLNPWASEVMARHPEITVCDQWQYVKDNEAELYKDWWGGKNVHFGGQQAEALGRLLAIHVGKVTAGKK